MYSLKIIQNKTKDMFNSTVLMFSGKSYMFNCCEGTQRNAADQGIKFKNINSIFFSSSEIDCYSGVFGFLMSRSEQIVDNTLTNKNNKSKVKENKNNKQIKENKNDNKESLDLIEGDNLDFPKILKPKNELEIDKYNVILYGAKGLKSRFLHSNGFITERLKNQIAEFSNGNFECNHNNFLENYKNNLFMDENIKIFTFMSKSDSEKSNKFFSDNLGPFHKENLECLSYFVIPHQMPRSINVDKCRKHRVKLSDYKNLKNNISCINEVGETIHPDMVLEEIIPSSCMGYLYSSTLNHAKDMINQVLINKDFNIGSKRSDGYFFSIVIHILGSIDILYSKEYKNFINSFNYETLHVIDCEESNYKFMLNKRKYNQLYILNQIDGNLFNLPILTDNDLFPLKELSDDQFSKNFLNCNPTMDFTLYKLENMGFINRSPMETPNYYKSKIFEKFRNEFEEFTIKEKLNLKEFNKNKIETSDMLSNNEPFKITFLGTLSMKPGIHRNVSCIMVKIKDKYIFMDCGEGSYQQLHTYYGEDITDKILCNTSVIFITHKHGDHMLGILKMLNEFENLFLKNKISEILYVIVPKSVIKFVKNLVSTLKSNVFIRVIDCESLNPSETKVYDKFIGSKDPHKNFTDVDLVNEDIIAKKINDFKLKFQGEYENKDLILENKIVNNVSNSDLVSKFYKYINTNLNIDIFSVEVFHCDDSFGCIIQSCKKQNHSMDVDSGDMDVYKNKEDFKISYSGDTRPCNNFINYCYNSTVIIHEATLEDELFLDAKYKMHSTFEEACNVCDKTKSKHYILTHFSPRYLKESPWNNYLEDKKVLIANDYLSVNFSDLDYAYNYGKKANEVLNLLDKEDKL